MTLRGSRAGAQLLVCLVLAAFPRFAGAEEKAPADKAQADKAPADKAPADKAPADKAPADKAEPAPSTDADKARALFRDGRALAASGKFEEACPKFEESLKLDPGIGTQFNLADCLEHTGHPKRAQAMFLRVADAAHQAGQAEREQVARDRARALEEKLPVLGIEVKEVVEGLEVSIDGKAIDRTKWASGERVEPGAHEIVAKAPNKKTWSLSVEVAASGKLMIKVPKLDDDSAKAAVAPVEKAKEPAEEPPPEKPKRTEPSTVNQTVKIFLLSGAGVGVLLAGTGFAIYKMSNDNAKSECPSSVDCTLDEVERHQAFIDDAATGRAIGYLGLGVTGAALIGFAVVSLTSGSGSENAQSTSIRAAPLLGGGALGASLRGRF